MVNKRSFYITLALISATLPIKTLASDWGCQCLLCLSDPRGPTTESECNPPIKKLWRHLAKGKPFPTCDIVGDSGSRANLGNSHYGLCPEGYSTLGKGQIAFKISEYKKNAVGIPLYVGSGDNSTTQTEPKVCVNELIGTKDVTIPVGTQSANTIMGMNQQPEALYSISSYNTGYTGISTKTIKASAYTDIKQLPYYGSMIDVYIDGAIYQRVPVGR